MVSTAFPFFMIFLVFLCVLVFLSKFYLYNRSHISHFRIWSSTCNHLVCASQLVNLKQHHPVWNLRTWKFNCNIQFHPHISVTSPPSEVEISGKADNFSSNRVDSRTINTIGMSVFHDEVEIEDFEFDDDTQLYFYPCPCGDRFEISKEQLESGEDVAECPSCSLLVRVIYDPDMFMVTETVHTTNTTNVQKATS